MGPHQSGTRLRNAQFKVIVGHELFLRLGVGIDPFRRLGKIHNYFFIHYTVFPSHFKFIGIFLRPLVVKVRNLFV
jgi:hypothetical protein